MEMKKIRMNPAVLNWSWRYLYELISNTDREIKTSICVCFYLPKLCALRGTGKATCQCQRAYLGPTSWFS